LQHNLSYGVRNARLFEIGSVFFARENEDLPEERQMIGGIISGSRSEVNWQQKEEPVDFFDIKGKVEDLLEAVNITEPVFQPGSCPSYYEEASSARLVAAGQTLGWLGRVDIRTARSFGLKEPAYLFELDLEAVMTARRDIPQFTPLPRFPAVSRDLAIILDRNMTSAKVREFIFGLGENFLTDVLLFDMYEGSRIEKNQKSLAFRLMYRSPDRTLTDEEVNEIHQRIMNQTLREFNASLQA